MPAKKTASKKKPKVEVEVETEVETTVENEVETTESAEKQAFRALIEAYKIQNPAKYETKKEVLLAQLNALN